MPLQDTGKRSIDEEECASKGHEEYRDDRNPFRYVDNHTFEHDLEQHASSPRNSLVIWTTHLQRTDECNDGQ